MYSATAFEIPESGSKHFCFFKKHQRPLVFFERTRYFSITSQLLSHYLEISWDLNCGTKLRSPYAIWIY